MPLDQKQIMVDDPSCVIIFGIALEISAKTLINNKLPRAWCMPAAKWRI